MMLAQQQRLCPAARGARLLGAAGRARCAPAPCASKGSASHLEGGLSAEGLSLVIVVSRFNELVTKPLLEGALSCIERHNGELSEVQVVHVPGAFEIPLVAKRLAASGQFDAVVCLGAVVRGATTHYDSVAGSAASGLLSAGMDTGVPIIFGVLTCDTMEQALDRAGGKLGNKGYEAALTAIEMANLMQELPSLDEDDDDDDDDEEEAGESGEWSAGGADTGSVGR